MHQSPATRLPGLHAAAQLPHICVSERAQRSQGTFAHPPTAAVDRQGRIPVWGKPSYFGGDSIEWNRQICSGYVAFIWHVHIDRHAARFGDRGMELVRTDLPTARNRRGCGRGGGGRSRNAVVRCAAARKNGDESKQCSGMNSTENRVTPTLMWSHCRRAIVPMECSSHRGRRYPAGLSRRC